jgi:hypothetical protein
MVDESEYPKRGYDTKDLEAMRAAAPRRRRHWGTIALASIILVPIAVFALWAWITLSYVYSTGDRAGYVQKFSQKGWLCKTWEGELAQVSLPGAMPEIFYFSVRDDRVAADIQRQMGNRVTLTYDEHPGVPTSCFGETDYFVTSVRGLEQSTSPGAVPPALAVPPVTPTPSVAPPPPAHEQ